MRAAKRNLIYWRGSQEDQVEYGHTKDVQIDSCEAYIKSKEALSCLETDILGDAGSGRNMDRDGLQKALSRVKKDLYENWVVHKFDRLSRRARDHLFIMDICERHGVALHSVQESIDTSLPYGRMIKNFLAGYSEMEVEIIMERINDGVSKRADKGLHPGKAPDCFTTIKKDKDKGTPGATLILPENEADVLRWQEAARLYLEEGLNLAEISRRTGINYHTLISRWTDENIWYLCGMTSKRINKKYIVAEARFTAGDKIWLPAQYDEIYSKTTGEAIVARREAQKNQGRRSRSLIAPLARCGECGRTMFVRYDRAGRRQVACDHRDSDSTSKQSIQRSEGKVLNTVGLGLEYYINLPEVKLAMKEKIEDEHSIALADYNSTMSRVEASRAQLGRRQNAVLDMYADGGVEKAQIKAYQAKIYEDKLQLEEAELRAKERLEQAQLVLDEFEEAREALYSLGGRFIWDNIEEKTRRELLLSWVEYITIYPDYLVIHPYKLPAYRVYYEEAYKKNQKKPGKNLERETGLEPAT